MKSFEDGVGELHKLMDLSRQQWLLGAGVSTESGIPLMYPLTERVKACLDGGNLELFETVMEDLSNGSHVEHALSHLGDLMALASRSKNASAKVGEKNVGFEELRDAYRAIVACIATTVRYGYKAASNEAAEKIGTNSDPIVDVNAHLEFVRKLFKRRANLESRSQIGFATTNYDTLLEDALAIDKRVAHDGFSGGAIAHWDGRLDDPMAPDQTRGHRVLKLHGSVDWFIDPECGLLRVRYGVKYLADLANTLIYPQATKYVETQKDPFARIFSSFRSQLRAKETFLLALVGYSFGDDHINSEIKTALQDGAGGMIVLAFSKEIPTGEGSQLCKELTSWLDSSKFGSRVYVASDKALYNGTNRFVQQEGAVDMSWWRFDGLMKFLDTGVPK